MNGLELAAAVRDLWPTVGILLISGNQDLSADDVVPDAFLAKPLSADRLPERVGKLSASKQPVAADLL